MNRRVSLSRLLLVGLLGLSLALPLGGCVVAEASRRTAGPAKPAEVAEWGSPDEEPGDAFALDGLAPATVISVVDGDTARVQFKDGTQEKVRFIGVDTPESTNQIEAYGKEASAFTKRTLLGKKVWIEQDAEARDRYERLLAYVWLEEPVDRSDAEVRAKMFNAHLALEGYAQQMTIPPNVRYADHFKEYVAEAREQNRGLWGLVDSSAAADEPITTAYVANRNSGKFHRSNCNSVQKMKPTNRVPYETREQVIGDGYIPCKICDP